MEQDKHVKQILFNSTESASKGFTDTVLKRINGLSVLRTSYQPLLVAKWERVFLYTFLFIAITIILLCVLIAYTHTDAFKWIRSWELPVVGYSKVLTFILCFWIVFAGNVLLQKKLMHSK